MAGCLMLLYFMTLGTVCLWRRMPSKGWQIKVWMGSVLGMMAMMWLPSLFAFFMDFTVKAQYCAMGAGLLLTGVSFLTPVPKIRPQPQPPVLLSVCLVVPFLMLSAYLQYTHVLRSVDGALHVGQSTYGDLCLHLGIATGLRGAGYPPEYTLLPGTLLGYPFLFDALSASMQMLGTGLTASLIIPGTLAMGLVYWGFVLTAWEMTKDCRAVAVAFLLVFVNGGLGFLYVLDGWPADSAMLREVFEGYYRTPTNMPDYNLRWVNVICDMMIPQRTILAGWMTFFPALYLLIQGMRTGKKSCFAALGLWAGTMPMIHTHTFLALGLLSVGCMMYELTRLLRADRDRRLLSQRLGCYLLYGGIAVMLALPQLLTWTFPQSIAGGKLAFRFNWVNNRGDGSLIDGYFWFWIKNVGLVYLLLVPAALNAPKRIKPLALGALVIYGAAELFQFQPNEYDNNKLFYVAFMVMMPMVGRLMTDLWDRMKGIKGRWSLIPPLIVVCLLSGGLSIGREIVSDYPLFSRSEVEAADYIEHNTPPQTIFLTGGQHNNAVSSLTGRSLVCGTGTYLYFHGVDYAKQAEDVRKMYERPEQSRTLFDRYNVDYIYISPSERGQFQIDEESLRRMFDVWYQTDDVLILQIQPLIKYSTARP